MVEEYGTSVEATVARLDERTKHFADTLNRIEAHMTKQTDEVDDVATLAEVNANNIRRIYWLIGGTFVVGSSLFGVMVAALGSV